MKQSKKKQYYRLDNEKRVIIIDNTVKPTAEEREDVIMFGRMGYTTHIKIQRSTENKPNANSELNEPALLEALKGNEAAIEEYQRIKKTKGKGGGFFAARSYALKQIKKK